MILKQILVLSFTFLTSLGITQEATLNSDIFKHYKNGKSFFSNKLYGAAQQEMDLFLSRYTKSTVEKQNRYLLEARQIIAITSLQLNQTEGEKLLTDFIEKHDPDPIIIRPVQELASYYYNEKQYAKAIYFYDKINTHLLPAEEMSEANFKKGYSYFVNKEFAEAELLFAQVKDFRNKFYYPVNYYYGMCQYFGDDYVGAVKSFDRVSTSSAYSSLIPYYIAQIYFAQNEFEKLINYGERVIRNPQTQQIKHIRLLLGEAYFKKDLYAKALPHLEYYEANTNKLTIEEFYQLAFTQYQLKKYEDAINNFQEISLLDSQLGQLVNYYLADCFLKTGNLTSSRTAFKKVSQMPYESRMQEEATFNFGKLSAEANFDREAINTLVKIEESSPYFSEARKIINDLLINSGDYINSIAIIESLDNLSEDLKATYQVVSLNQALLELRDNDVKEASYYLKKSKIYPHNVVLEARADFWQAELLNREENYRDSQLAFERFFTKYNEQLALPEEASIMIARYIQGYNYLKQNQYDEAEGNFKAAVVELNYQRENIQKDYILLRILPDALLRSGDCLFKRNAYQEARVYYDQVINRQSNGFIYAMYQKGLIQGLLGQPYDKIITLEEIAQKYPGSEYADDALVQLGDTYLGLGNVGPASVSFNRVVSYYQGKSNLVNQSYIKLGLISYNNGDLEKALGYYKKVFENNPNPKESQEALLAIEEIYLDDKSDSDGYINFLETIPGYKVSAFARDSLNFEIGQNQFENGEYDKAVVSFDNYLERFPKGYYRLDVLYYRGESYSLLKNYGRALRDYKTLVNEGYNDYYQASMRKAAVISYNYTQNFADAYKYYKLWAENTEDVNESYEAILGALRSAFRLGKYAAVKSFAPKIINSSMATNEDKLAAYYYLGKSSLASGEEEQALNALKQLTQGRNNQSAEANYLIAKIYFEQNQLNLAEKQINYTAEQNSAYPYWVAKSLILYADVYIQKNDLFNARAALEAVTENFTRDVEIIEIAQAKLEALKNLEKETSRIKKVDTSKVELDSLGGN